MNNRQLRFRVWDGIDYMSTPFTLKDLQEKKVMYASNTVVMQYTGLKDKNGKEIYEGDFLKLIDEYRGKGEKPSYVIFKDSQWMMQGTMHYTHVDSINNYCLDKMEIIGNIYQNPELLTQ